MKILIRLSLIFISIFYNAYAGNEKRHVQGVVFFDENKNGIKDDREYGVAGVSILTLEGQQFLSGNDGKFSGGIKFSGEFEQISIHLNSLPPGSILTTPPLQYVPKGKKSIHFINFGLTYPETTKDFSATFQRKTKLVKKTYSELNFTVDDYKVFLNGINILNFERQGEAFESKRVTLPIRVSQEKISFNEFKLKETLKNLGEETKKISVSTVRLQLLLPPSSASVVGSVNDVVRKLTALVKDVFPSAEVDTTYAFTGKELSISLVSNKVMPMACRLYFENLNYSLSSLQKVTYRVSNQLDEAFSLDCSGRSREFDILFNGENFLLKSDGKSWVGPIKQKVQTDLGISEPQSMNTNEIQLSHSKYLEHSRDLWLHFSFRGSGNRRLTLNGQSFHLKGEKQGYLFKASPGKNKLDMAIVDDSGKEFWSRYVFDVFKDRKLYLGIALENYRLESRSSRFDFNYDVPALQRISFQGKFFPHRHWGLSTFLNRDLNSSDNVELAGGGVDTAVRSEIGLYLSYRRRFNLELYDSPFFIFYAGVLNKRTELSKEAIINFAEPFSGPSFGLEILKEDFLANFLTSSTQTFYSREGGGASVSRLTQEFRFSLNSLGKFFGGDGVRIYDTEYPGWKNLRFLFGFSYEQDKRPAENADATVRDEYLSYRVGVAYEL